MSKCLVVILVILLASCASGEDFILRATSDCCDGDPGFLAGSKAQLLDGGRVRGNSELRVDSHFVFKDISAGKYDLIVSAAGYYPEKFLGLEIGSGGVFDFEFVAPLQPTSRSAILEGHVIVRFKRTLSDKEIIEHLNAWGFDVLRVSKLEEGSKPPKHRITRMHSYAEVRAAYDRSEDLSELIWTALQDPVVIECTPLYFSKRE
jgi:hypothetical protein